MAYRQVSRPFASPHLAADSGTPDTAAQHVAVAGSNRAAVRCTDPAPHNHTNRCRLVLDACADADTDRGAFVGADSGADGAAQRDADSAAVFNAFSCTNDCT